MLPTNPFSLDGWRYWSEARRCGKAACQRCASGERHPGYWYRRNQMTGEREYLGRQLDDAIVQRADRLAILSPTISSHIVLIQADVALLEAIKYRIDKRE